MCGANIDHPTRRHGAPVAATEVNLTTGDTCPANAGAVSPACVCVIGLNSIIFLHLGHLVVVLFKLGWSSLGSRIRQLSSSCCTFY